MICKECGAQIDDNARECPFCGAVYEENSGAETKEESAPEIADAAEAVSEAPGDTENTPAVPEDDGEDESDILLDENEIKRRRQMERMRAEKQSQLEEIERRREEKRKRQKRKKIIIAAVIIVCVAAAAAGGVYIFRNNDDGNVVLSTEPPSQTPLPTMPVISPTPAAETASPAPSATAAPSWEATGGGSTSSSSGSSSGGSSSGSSSSGRYSGGSSSGSSSGTSSGSSGSSSSGSSSGSSGSSASSGGSSSSGRPSTSAATTGGGNYSAEGGMTGDRFTAALVTGGEVIRDGGRTYMTFTYNGATYYANVDASSYTEYIQGKPITLSAYPTSEVYNGNTVYEITAITHYTGDYIFPNSGFELLDESDLAGKSKDVLALGRNEIFARHGRQFTMDVFREYFENCSWYTVDPNYNYDDDASNLNAIERANVEFIKAREDSMN